MVYNFKQIEQKWQRTWEQKKVFEVKGKSNKPKFYVLDMFPYPSGAGLHIGHAFVFSLGDIFARFKRLQGFNVIYPIGYDSLGLPAENAAIRDGTHPKEYIKKSIANFMKQQKAMGWSYDWSRMIKTSDSDFYKWDQWIFLKLLEKGLAYKKESAVNWCPECKTVLANEQVHNGKCEYHGDTDVEIKHLNQWFFKITNYAEELLKGLDKIDWSDRAKKLQRNWIGKSHGTEIKFDINGEDWNIFTTRPDTLFGVTFMVVSAQHTRLWDLITDKQKKDVEKFLKKLKSVSEKELESMDKEGVFTGSYAINPLTNEKVPVYAGNFVLADYGCGMVMAVPAHDKRDFEFAKKYKLKIKQVIFPKGMTSKEASEDIKKRAYVGEGKLINSGKFNGVGNKTAIGKITKYLKEKKFGKRTTQYKLRDWSVSRQRYWGTPIPIVYCDKCDAVPVPEKDLPIKLPDKVKFGKGNPLETNESWIKTKCPKCKGSARRETDTMDTFVNSSWYFLRYCDPKNSKAIFDKKKIDYWCPIDQYIGGPEHITMHLIYARFYTKFLRDIGLIKFGEPALRYFTQGIVKASDGYRMSKTRENVVEPLDMIDEYGADALRLYLVSNSSPENDFDWSDKGMKSSFKFVKRVYDYFDGIKFGKSSAKVESKLNQSIERITKDVEGFKHNLAVIKLRQLFESFDESVDKKTAESFLKMLHIYCPYVTEELWSKINGGSEQARTSSSKNRERKDLIDFADWPKANLKKINKKLEDEEDAISKLVGDIAHVKKLTGKINSKVYIYVLPNELKIYKDVKGINLFAVNDKEKHDPENKSKKVKPGRPGIYLE